jgi:hypothetical protein
VSEVQTSFSCQKQSSAAPSILELDESRWQAWVLKNRAKDRIRSARPKRIRGGRRRCRVAAFVIAQMLGLTR